MDDRRFVLLHGRARAQFLVAVVADILGDAEKRGATFLSRDEGRQVNRILDEAQAVARTAQGVVSGG